MSESLLIAGESLPLPVLARNADGATVYFTHAAPDPGRINEDALLLMEPSPGRMIAAVADGAGGRAGAGEAARIALHALRESILAAHHDPIDLLAPILRGIEEAQGRIQSIGTGAGTTLVVAELNGQWLRTYNVGDSGALLTGQRGRIGLQTLMHSPTGYAVQAGIMEESAALRHDDRHVVSNLLGTPDMHVEVSNPVRMQPRDTLILASDGVYDNLLTHQITNLIRTGDLLSAANRLRAEIDRRMNDPVADDISKPDDCTFMLLRREVSAGASSS